MDTGALTCLEEVDALGVVGWYNPLPGCKLVYDRGKCTYFLHDPVIREKLVVNEITSGEIDNQDQSRVISLDPGVCTSMLSSKR
jgi:hypothetical protein